jgi:hypothetical protein
VVQEAAHGSRALDRKIVWLHDGEKMPGALGADNGFSAGVGGHYRTCAPCRRR